MGKKQAHTAKVRAEANNAQKASKEGRFVGPMQLAEVQKVAEKTEEMKLDPIQETLREIHMASQPGWRR